MSDLLTVLSALGFGVLSSIIPLFNSELYVGVVAAAARPQITAIAVLAMAVGTVAGKLFLFVLASRGSEKFGVGKAMNGEEKPLPATRFKLWLRQTSDLLMAWLGDSRLGPLTILLAASVGIPPLFVVAVMAGVARQNIVLFAVAVFVGRLARFAVVAVPIALAAH
ncbi:hypothetical protein D9V41_03340 [Aeromicrobium phragmitis]|uniref:Uncharacterized protein n=1 Tax=Aeromicrobium phragmitis TaxID=2478914 RepID=A0A3L8PPR5_9ACTN|nr:hypothetical protein [Aeromicrobium phragmitis]RLV56819.1 hypothetical protein D9V41_03340 [Aeromicrobium phragmitis]